jgi:hypothetical protein
MSESPVITDLVIITSEGGLGSRPSPTAPPPKRGGVSALLSGCSELGHLQSLPSLARSSSSTWSNIWSHLFKNVVIAECSRGQCSGRLRVLRKKKEGNKSTKNTAPYRHRISIFSFSVVF